MPSCEVSREELIKTDLLVGEQVYQYISKNRNYANHLCRQNPDRIMNQSQH